jgi:hypothetical protein
MTTLRARAALALGLLAGTGPAAAGELSWQGFLEARWVAGDGRSWVDGGLGKTRFGDDADGQVGAALALSWQVTPDLLAFVELQAQPDMTPELDVTVATLRWRPVSTTAWRWALKAGVFFPPVSLENDSIGWTSRWTLTPSAINSWVGEELRSTGLEAQLEHRGELGTLSGSLALFGGNEPAGELLATRGWALGDFTTGYFGELRQPDVHAAAARTRAPFGFEPFQRIEGDVGWHAQLHWETPAFGEFSLLRYDNRADPAAFRQFANRRLFAWHTRFWSAGWQYRFGDLQIVAQAMDGATAFEPAPGRYMDSRFDSAFVLAAWESGAWRPAVRIEQFRVRQLGASTPLNEEGSAVTVALNWRPSERWRVTGEWLRVRSERAQRRLGGEAAKQTETQVQLNIRWLF